jgi:hypothetical protein
MEKQNGCPARHVSARSRRLAQWQCLENRYIYRTKVCTRTKEGGEQACPCHFCYGGPRVDLRDFPDAYKKYVRTKLNRGFKLRELPDLFKVFWRCETNPSHVWYESFNKLQERNFECRKCFEARSDRLSNFSELVAEIHPSEIERIDPSKILHGSHQMITWKCPHGPDHVWQARVYNRTLNQAGCPCCANRQISVTNCLATVKPSLAKDFHPARNGLHTVDNVIATSTKTYWWRCENCSHEWQATARARTAGKGCCPSCKAKPVEPPVVSLVESSDSMLSEVGRAARGASKNLKRQTPQRERAICAGDMLTSVEGQIGAEQPTTEASKNLEQLATKGLRGISAGDVLTSVRRQNEGRQSTAERSKIKRSLLRNSHPVGSVPDFTPFLYASSKRTKRFARGP